MRLAVEYDYCKFIVSAKNETATGPVMSALVQTVQTLDGKSVDC